MRRDYFILYGLLAPIKISHAGPLMVRAYLEIGQTLQLTGKNGLMVHGTGFTWESSNTAVATVSPSGLVTAVGPGTAVLTVYTTGDPVINQNHVTIYVGNQTMGIGSGSVDQSNAE